MMTSCPAFDAVRSESRVGKLAGPLAAIIPARLPLQPKRNRQHDHVHMPMTHIAHPPEPFVASTEKPFAQLMDDAMAVMDAGMRSAAMNGNPDHDFVAMMIPHHQGAIDMAKALLLDTRDPELRNLAQGIITEQQNEIRLMQAWLARHRKVEPAGARPAIPNAR